MKKILYTLSVTLAVFIVGFFVTQNIQTAKADLGGNVNILPASYMKFATTSVSSSAVSLVLATSTGRSWAVISNTGTTAVYLYFDSGTTSLPFYANQPNTASTTTSCGASACETSNAVAPGGILLSSLSNYEIKLDNLYQGAIYAIGASSSADVISVTANQ